MLKSKLARTVTEKLVSSAHATQSNSRHTRKKNLVNLKITGALLIECFGQFALYMSIGQDVQESNRQVTESHLQKRKYTQNVVLVCVRNPT
jgi:hypothetical protein